MRWTTKPDQLADGVGHLTVLTDMTAEMDLVRERDHLARTDPVTGLMNRRAAEEVLEREASRAQRFGSRISVGLIDLDHFKQVNDRFGHGTGDEVLRRVADVANKTLRASDMAARWGGEEFLVVLTDTGFEGALMCAERIRAAVERLELARVGNVTISAGVSELVRGEEVSIALLRADELLYKAKSAGRNCVRP